MSVDALLTADELAERWQVERSQVYRLAREGRIPAVRIGRYLRFRLDLIEEFEAGRLETPANGPATR
jgi:excisionase family DNA binding protein